MSRLSFFRADPLSLAQLAETVGAVLAEYTDPSRMIDALAPLERAGPHEIGAYDADRPLDELRETRAGACLVAPAHLAEVPPATVALVVPSPRQALAQLAALLHPASFRPGSAVDGRGIDPSARIAETARLEPGVIVDPGAIIGPHVEIGSGTIVGAGTLVGAGVRIGRDCAIDAGVTLIHALLGDRVTIHAGARLGSVSDRWREPSLGRVIVQNEVRIGANAVIPRGRSADTILGEGASIAALTILDPDAVVPVGADVGGRADARRVSPPSQMV